MTQPQLSPFDPTRWLEILDWRGGTLTGWIDEGALSATSGLSLMVDGHEVGAATIGPAEAGASRRPFAASVPEDLRDGAHRFVALRLRERGRDAAERCTLPRCLRFDPPGGAMTDGAVTRPAGADAVEGAFDGLEADVISGWLVCPSVASADPHAPVVTLRSAGRVVGRAPARPDGGRLRFTWAPAPGWLPTAGPLALEAHLDVGAIDVRPAFASATLPSECAHPTWTTDEELVELAEAAELSERLHRAIALHDLARERRPDDASEWLRVARCLVKLDRPLEADSLAARAVEIGSGPTLGKALAVRARAAEMTRRPDLALELWRRALPHAKGEGDRRRALSGVVRGLVAVDRASEALAPLHEALRLERDHGRLLRDYARLLDDLGHADEACAASAALALANRGVAPRARRAAPPDPPWVATRRRYRSAMAGGAHPVALAAGHRGQDVAVAEVLRRTLAQHLGCRVDLVLPRRPVAALRAVLPKAHRRVVPPPEPRSEDGAVPEPPKEAAELLLVLPEYMTTTGSAALPHAGMVANFLDTRRMVAGGEDERLRAYAAWLGELMGMPPPPPLSAGRCDRVAVDFQKGVVDAGPLEAVARAVAPLACAARRTSDPTGSAAAAEAGRGVLLLTDRRDSALAAALAGDRALLFGHRSALPAFLTPVILPCPARSEPVEWTRAALRDVFESQPAAAVAAGS